MSVTTNHNWLRPTRNKLGNVVADDWLAEHHAIENVANGSIGRLPHLLEIELFYTRLVWRDGCALHANTVFKNCVRRIDCYLVVRCVTMFDTEVVVLKVDIKIRKDETILDKGPHNASHFIAIKLDYGVDHLDLCCHYCAPILNITNLYLTCTQ